MDEHRIYGQHRVCPAVSGIPPGGRPTLFQSKPYGILRLVDEESNINNGTDESMLAKLNQFLKVWRGLDEGKNKISGE